VKERVRRHIEAKSEAALAIGTPPGSGKSYNVSELGLEQDIAWIAERHKMIENVPSLKMYRRNSSGKGGVERSANEDGLEGIQQGRTLLV
jgi:hypothetical protein